MIKFKAGQSNRYLVIFDDLPERRRFFNRNGFIYEPESRSENRVRWVCPRNGADREHWLEMFPADDKDENNEDCLSLYVQLHKVKEGA